MEETEKSPLGPDGRKLTTMNQSQNGGHARRLDAYVRVSHIGSRDEKSDSFISPKVQEDRIRAWAAAHGHEIIQVWHELDVSGGTMDRPLLNQVMARIDSGETEGVVVFNLSRFARTLVGSLELIERINDRGALFGSVQDNFDITTVNGRMVMNILLSIAQAERERSRENWRIACAEAVDRGIHVSPPQFGYLRGRGPVNPKTGKPAPAPLEVDPDTGSIVTEIFRRRAGGQSITEIRKWLNESGVPTVRGAQWQNSALVKIIRCRTYLGIATGGRRAHKNDPLPEGKPGAHPALTDEATWQAAQPRPGMRFSYKEAPSLLRGLVRCGGCRYTMSARVPHRGQPGKSNYYQCNRGGHADDCPAQTSIPGSTDTAEKGLDDLVVEAMWKELNRVEFEQFDEALDVAEDEHERDELVARRDRDAQDEELESALGHAAWVRHLAALTARIGAKQSEIDEKQRLAGRPGGRPVAELREKWESGEMSMSEKRAHLSRAIQMVFVKPAGMVDGPARGRLRDARLAQRMHIIWAHEPEFTDIPRQGKAGFVTSPFPFPDANPDAARVVPLQPEMEHAGDAVG